jgi:multidrug efflux pump subunit AcrA (membrane-fusion protein)
MAALCLLLAGCGEKQEEQPKPVVAVKVASAETATVRLSVEAPATIFPLQQAAIAARIVAHIRSIGVRKGENAAAGQVLVELESRDLAAQRQEAEAAVSEAHAGLEKTRAGTLPADLERARGQLSTAEAALNQAQKIYERRQELLKQGAIPGRDVLTAETDLAKARADRDTAAKELDVLQHQSGEGDIRMAESHLEQAQARLETAAAQLNFTQIRSPFAGSVTEQLLYPGDLAQPGSPILTLMDLSTAVARAQVPAAGAATVRSGQACEFAPEDASPARFVGRVSMVNQAVDPARRTIEVWCNIPNPKRALRANVFGNLTIETGEEPASVVVPQTAVQFAEGTSHGTVLVVDAKRIAHRRQVEAGRVFDGRVQIKSGLEAGERVVVEGGYGMPDGTEVKW